MEERGQMGFFRLFVFGRGVRQTTRAKTTRAFLKVEALETRFLPSGATISGFVYHDANNNGIYDAGETPLANTPIELHNSLNKVIATAVTDGNGFYSFT